jgi:hypothetical protein
LDCCLGIPRYLDHVCWYPTASPCTFRFHDNCSLVRSDSLYLPLSSLWWPMGKRLLDWLFLIHRCCSMRSMVFLSYQWHSWLWFSFDRNQVDLEISFGLYCLRLFHHRRCWVH